MDIFKSVFVAERNSDGTYSIVQSEMVNGIPEGRQISQHGVTQEQAEGIERKLNECVGACMAMLGRTF